MLFRTDGVRYDTSQMIAATGAPPFLMGVYITPDYKRVFAPLYFPVTGIRMVEVQGDSLHQLAQTTRDTHILRAWQTHSQPA